MQEHSTRLYPQRNCVDRETALRMWTENATWFSNEEGKKGRIQVGQYADLIVPDLSMMGYDDEAAGSPHRWEDYDPGERIDHVSGITLEDSDHMFSTRLYQNTARVHFDAYAGKNTRFGRRLAYGGHVISLARELSFNGLANGFRVAAINGGSHVGPTFGGDTIYAWSEILGKAELPQRSDIGALRVRMIATKDCPCSDFPGKGADGKYHPAVVLDLDYWLLMPRR